MRAFLVCIHDATPAYDRQTRAMIGDVAHLVGRRISAGVVPDWHGAWPLAAHPRYCRMLRESAEELLLHGNVHRRQRGRGPVTWLTGGSDEMNGLDRVETRHALAQGQRAFTEAFGAPARGFLAPAWQRGHVRGDTAASQGLEHVLGFFSLESGGGRRIPLTTWSWDCGRWDRLGYVGDGIGRLLHWIGRGVPVLALHPRDLERGFWRRILGLIEALLEAGYEPATAAGLLEGTGAEVDL